MGGIKKANGISVINSSPKVKADGMISKRKKRPPK